MRKIVVPALALALLLGLLAGRPEPGSPPAPPEPGAAAAPRSAPPAPAAPPTESLPASRAPGGPGRRVYPRETAPRRGSPGEIAAAALAEYGPRLGLDRMPGALALRASFRSAVGLHVRYDQVVGGVSVYGSEVSVHTDREGRVLVVNADVFPVPGAPPAPRIGPRAAREAARAEVRDGGEEADTKEPRLVLLPRGKGAALCWLVDTRTEDESVRVFVDAQTGKIADEADLRRAETGTGRVFAPNPIFTSRNVSLTDRRDADSSALTAELVTVDLPRLDGSGYLRGKWVDLTPTRGDAVSSTGTFLYTRSQDEFEQVNSYHHVDTMQAYIQDVLGYDNVNARAQEVDAHGTWEDNAWYDLYDRTIYLGDGGVDSGEDGDVILHEYGHAVQDDQVPDFGILPEGGAMGEGFGDYLGTTGHDSGDPAFDAAFGSWDAVSFDRGSPPAIRRVDGTKVYPRDWYGEVHEDGEIWSSALWSIRAAIGAVEADRVIIGAHFLLTPRADFEDGGQAILAANESLRGGADRGALISALSARGIPLGDVPLVAVDDYEPNDSSAEAARVAAGTTLALTLEQDDDDYFEIDDVAGRNVQAIATFDGSAVDLDLSLLTGEGEVVAESATTASRESVSFLDPAAGPDRLIVRVHPASGSGEYELTVLVTPITVLAGRKLAGELAAGEELVVGLEVPGASSRIRVKAKRRGKGGAEPEVEVLDPGGTVVIPYGSGATRKGTRIDLAADAAGTFYLRLRPRDATGGRFKLKTRVK